MAKTVAERQRKYSARRQQDGDDRRLKQLRVQYWQEIGAVNLKDLVFVDETGCNLAMTRCYARAPKGTRAYNDAPYQRGSNLTLIGAMALRGLVGEMTLPGAK